MQSGTLLHLALLRKTSNANKKQKSHIQMINYRKNQIKTNAGGSVPELFQRQNQSQNFVLTGWSTEQNQLKNHLKQLKMAQLNVDREAAKKFNLKKSGFKLEKLRQSYEQKKPKESLHSSRSNIKTSQYASRARNRSHSLRNYLQYKSVHESKLQRQQRQSGSNEKQSNQEQNEFKLREISSQTQIKPLKKCNKVNICYDRPLLSLHMSSKQNQQSILTMEQISEPNQFQIRKNKRRVHLNVSKNLHANRLNRDKQKCLKQQSTETSFSNFFNLNLNNIRMRKFFKA